jgi:myo-inositol-1(or 4)-monophosphatase
MEALLKDAGERLRTAVNEEIGLKYKGSDYRDIVTEYDVEIENFLIDKISKEFPGHGFITEESNGGGREFSEYTWIIDPIDGTVNFVSVGKDFSISLALYKNKNPYIGMVYDVMNDLLYCGVTGKGAFLNGEPMVKSKSTHGLKDSLVDISLNSINLFEKEKNIPISRLIKYIRGHRAYGSASLALCRIARGELQAYISASLSIWDYAAAIIILGELGGSYTYLVEKNSKDILTNPATFAGAENVEILQELKNIVGNKFEYIN